MASDRRYGWLGETRRASLHALTTAVIEDWAKDWWLMSSIDSIDVQPDLEDSGNGSGLLPLFSDHEAGALAIDTGNRDFAVVGRLLVNLTSDVNDELAQRVGGDALSDLFARIHQRAGIASPTKATRSVLPAEFDAARFGSFAVRASLGRLQLRLVFDRRLVDRLVPLAASKHIALVSRQSMLQQAHVSLCATMDFGTVDLAQLSGLSVGEVLVGEHPLNKTIQIQLDGGDVVAQAHLKRSGSQRAVMFDGINHFQELGSHE